MTSPESNDLQFESKNVKTKLAAEIAPVPWEDLQRPFARGITLFVTSDLDLIEVAAEIAKNNISLVNKWINTKDIAAVTDQQAKSWFETNASLLTAIVKPWVLIQELKD